MSDDRTPAPGAGADLAGDEVTEADIKCACDEIMNHICNRKGQGRRTARHRAQSVREATAGMISIEEFGSKLRAVEVPLRKALAAAESERDRLKVALEKLIKYALHLDDELGGKDLPEPEPVQEARKALAAKETKP